MFSFLKNIFSSNNSAVEEVLQRGGIILDVRTSKEFNQGHLKGSKNIPLPELKSRIELIRSWERPVVTVCLSGSRSQIAKSILSAAGIEVYNGGSWMNYRS